MKKVFIYTNSQEKSLLLKATLMSKLKAAGIEVVRAEEAFDYVMTIGGDGTLLSAFHHFRHQIDAIQFIGIHTGHLGFYTDWQPYELDDLVEGLLKTPYDRIVSYPLLDIELTLTNKKHLHLQALNEISIRTNFSTMISDVYVKHKFFETLRCDGICVATPTGSTGLNKSLGGAVIHPRLDAIQLTEIASLNNRVYRSLGSPLIIAPDEWLIIQPRGSNPEAKIMIQYDNQSIETTEIDQVKLQISKSRIRFANIRHTHFWDRVEASFIGRAQENSQ